MSTFVDLCPGWFTQSGGTLVVRHIGTFPLPDEHLEMTDESARTVCAGGGVKALVAPFVALTAGARWYEEPTPASGVDSHESGGPMSDSGTTRPSAGPSEPEASGYEGPVMEEVPVQLHLTAAALDEIREMIADADLGPEGGLRLTARTGAGCSAPLGYGMFLEPGARPDDVVLSGNGVRIFLGPGDAWALDGLFIDYVSSPELGDGFAFRHPRGSGGPRC